MISSAGGTRNPTHSGGARSPDVEYCDIVVQGEGTMLGRNAHLRRDNGQFDLANGNGTQAPVVTALQEGSPQ